MKDTSRAFRLLSNTKKTCIADIIFKPIIIIVWAQFTRTKRKTLITKIKIYKNEFNRKKENL